MKKNCLYYNGENGHWNLFGGSSHKDIQMALDGYATKPQFKIGEYVLFKNILLKIEGRKWKQKLNFWVYYTKPHNDLDQDNRFKLHKCRNYDRSYEYYMFEESELKKLTDEKKLELL